MNATNRYFRCPFYAESEKRRDGQREIRCERGSRVVCPTKGSFDAHIERCCVHDYGQCSIARMLLDYYMEDRS